MFFNSARAQASAKAGSLIVQSISITSMSFRRYALIESNSARSATGSWNFCPGALMTLIAFLREQDGDGPFREIHLFGEDFAQLRAFLGRRSHERDLRIVLVEIPPLEFRRNGFRPVEIHHVEAAGRDDGGHACARGGFEPRRARRRGNRPPVRPPTRSS